MCVDGREMYREFLMGIFEEKRHLEDVAWEDTDCITVA